MAKDDDKIIIPDSVKHKMEKEEIHTENQLHSEEESHQKSILEKTIEDGKKVDLNNESIPDKTVIITEPFEKTEHKNINETIIPEKAINNSAHTPEPEPEPIINHIPPEPPKNDSGIHSSFSHSNGEKKDLVYIVYILYILGYVTGIANLIGVVLAYIVKDPDQPVSYSHYQEQIKIFWISLIGFIVGLLTVHIFLGVLILIFTYIWVIVKTIKGLLLLNKDKPFPKGEII